MSLLYSRPSVEDMGEDEQQAEFHGTAHSPAPILFRVISGDCGRGGYILQRKNMNDMASALSEYLKPYTGREISDPRCRFGQREIYSH